jgi:Rod binding domain-containing protein
MVSGIGGPPAVAAPLAGPKPADDQKRIAGAAKEFEALMIAQLLKSMRDAGEGGWLGTGDDQAGAQSMELAEEQLARALANQGGLGLAGLVAGGLSKADAARRPGAAQKP